MNTKSKISQKSFTQRLIYGGGVTLIMPIISLVTFEWSKHQYNFL
ncbi:MAG: hypothetical protein ACW97Z_12380 [Candidatus Hodarchaeales archaeon]|jgi:hypothetical protein